MADHPSRRDSQSPIVVSKSSTIRATTPSRACSTARLTLNFDLALTNALSTIGVGAGIDVIAGPDDFAHVRQRRCHLGLAALSGHACYRVSAASVT